MVREIFISLPVPVLVAGAAAAGRTGATATGAATIAGASTTLIFSLLLFMLVFVLVELSFLIFLEAVSNMLFDFGCRIFPFEMS